MLPGLRISSRHAGVSAHLSADAENHTGSIVIVVEGESRTMLTDRGANTQLDFGAIDAGLVTQSSWVHLTGYSMFHHSRPEAIPEFISSARGAGAQVMMDASSSGFLEDFGAKRFLEFAAEVSLLRCNAEEALMLADQESVSDSVAVSGKAIPRRGGHPGTRGCLGQSGEPTNPYSCHTSPHQR
jgi:sugar/nucleoside kinase (ribokinase family)